MTARARIAIGFAAALIVSAAWLFRYDIQPAPQPSEFVYRLDRWTGEVEVVDMAPAFDEALTTEQSESRELLTDEEVGL